MIAARNDAFRRRLIVHPPDEGRLMLTAGVASLPADTLATVLRSVARFETFTPDNDPWGEHDFGAFEIDGDRFFWKFDYYENAECEFGADDKLACYRVLTILFAREY
jgi:hypothetical protein